MRVTPTFAAPVITGRLVFAGVTAAMTTAVCAEVAVAEPALFVAVTVTRARRPTSAATSVYVAAVAPEMFAQLVELVQRAHWYLNVIGAVPVHVPVVALRVNPFCAVPETAGRTVFAGFVAAVVKTPGAATAQTVRAAPTASTTTTRD